LKDREMLIEAPYELQRMAWRVKMLREAMITLDCLGLRFKTMFVDTRTHGRNDSADILLT
jgi:hypothetical protein